eukprot:CAMPEP_0184406772 /NCGR_PEP_ID=MMETSP0738-20130409/1864_1 /TAXON_ID=385413 /ORGANISM="Thalassiosira miniscula, Strain CCMP1093" /LENGTH=248 /DNA_ID=CAMNT_0026763749 /DNA_START=240 /DNA_END=986 /DNA_ORIENTATION=-
MSDVIDKAITRAQSDSKRQRDFDDLQNEISGADTGRMRKFLGPNDDRTPEGKRKKVEQERLRQTLADLMRDPEYARLYVELGNQLRDAETQADTVLAMIQRQLAAVQEEVADMEASAARDPDGKQVFRFADGRVVYADGSDVSPEIAAGIIWPPNAPSAEDYFAAKTRQETLADQLSEWDTYRNDVLGDIRDRYDSDDPPMNRNDLKNALNDIEQLTPGSIQVLEQDSRNEVPKISTASQAAIPKALK